MIQKKQNSSDILQDIVEVLTKNTIYCSQEAEATDLFLNYVAICKALGIPHLEDEGLFFGDLTMLGYRIKHMRYKTKIKGKALRYGLVERTARRVYSTLDELLKVLPESKHKCRISNMRRLTRANDHE